MESQELAQALRLLRVSADEHTRSRWDRSLPFADALFDRWERAQRLGFADGVSIYDSACVFGDVTIGAHTWVGPHTLLDGSGGGLRIGSYCSISAGVRIYTHDTMRWALSGGALERETGPVAIGDCCYLGSDSVVARGVAIGDRCVVAANSFVNRDVADNTVVGGSPARRLGRVVGEGADIEVVYDGDRGDSA